jgi:gliding motility-associated protein GldM
MADSNASPRQKMINMMYLVLTALLALNVSAEILKAFHLVETSMLSAGANIDIKNQETYTGISKYKDDHPTDSIAIAAEMNAKKAMDISKEAVAYLQAVKDDLIEKTGGRHEDTNGDGKVDDEEIVGASNTEIHANIMIVQGKGTEIKNKINQIREQLLACVPVDKQGEIKSDLTTPAPAAHEGKQITWESQMFEHTPLAAVNTLLTKMQNDVRNTEAQVLNFWKQNLTGDVIVVDNFEAQIIPTNGTYISTGSKFTADIFLAAASSKTEATVTVNNTPVNVVSGIGKYEVAASGEGEKKFTAEIKTKRASGKEESYKKEFSYTVVKPLAVISATKMNVVYIGLANPISVSVPGYAASEVTPSIDPASAGTLKKDPETGQWLLEVKGGASKLKVVCSVKGKDGVTKRMGEQEYRIKMIPEPSAMIGTVEPGVVTTAELKGQSGVRAPLVNFPYEGISYKTVQYTLTISWKKRSLPEFSETTKSSPLTPGMIAALGRTTKGDKVIIEQYTVSGPGGNRMLKPVVYTIK